MGAAPSCQLGSVSCPREYRRGCYQCGWARRIARSHKRDPEYHTVSLQPALLSHFYSIIMSIFLCPSNVGVKNSIFDAKKIADKMPGKMSDLDIYAYPESETT